MSQIQHLSMTNQKAGPKPALFFLPFTQPHLQQYDVFDMLNILFT
jgi:hypothetical protein